MFATLVSPTRVSYQDVDGDSVTVTFSKAVLSVSNVNSILAFNTGEVGGSNATPQQLRSINLTGVTGAAGTSITTSAAKNNATGGDGLATLGQLNSGGMDLGNVTIDGDLGRITAGDTVLTTPGLGNFDVHSMGRYGTSTGALDLFSVVRGKVSTLNATTDIKDVYFSVRGTSFGDVNGSIGSISIGGHLVGGNSARSGAITAFGTIGTVRIDGDVRGGSSAGTGSIDASKIGNVTIGGSLQGSTGTDSGWIIGIGGLGNVRVEGDVIGGPGSGSASIYSFGTLQSLFVGGSLIGGHGDNSGLIVANGDIGKVQIRGNVSGSWGQYSGSIESTNGKLAGVTVGGSLTADSGEGGNYSGRISSRLDMGRVTIGGDVEGGYGTESGTIRSRGKLTGVTINGSLLGGHGEDSGTVRSVLGSGLVKIKSNLIGGAGFGSGGIGGNNYYGVDIGGSLIGGTGILSGRIWANQDVTYVNVGRDIVGGNAPFFSSGIGHYGSVSVLGRLGTLTLGGSLIAGSSPAHATILSGMDIGSITIGGSIRGNATSRATIYAVGGAGVGGGRTDLAIGRLTVHGNVINGAVVAGYAGNYFGWSNPDAQIGPVVVGGSWIASDLVAGIDPGADNLYGTSDDRKHNSLFENPNIESKITSVSIGGTVSGTPGVSGDHFGIVAQNIGSLFVRGTNTRYPLRPGRSNDNFLLSSSGDVRLREI